MNTKKSLNLLRDTGIILAGALLYFNLFLPICCAQDSNVPIGSQVNQRMTNMNLPDQNAAPRALSSLLKNKKGIVYVFSGCCFHCQKELKKVKPFLKEIKGQGIEAVGVQWRANSKLCSVTSQYLQLDGIVLADTTGKTCEMLGVGDFTLFVLDEKMIIRYRGGFDEEKINRSLELHKSERKGI